METKGQARSQTPHHPNNGQIKPDERFFFQEAKALEANKVFPTDAESAYLSSYFTDSYLFPYNPDPLVNGNSYRIYDEMRHDDQIKSALSFKKDLILSPGWEIKCEETEIKEVLENNLREEMGRCSIEDALRDIMSAYDYGFSLTEVLYKKPENGIIKLSDIKTRPPHTFEFHLTEKGDVEKIVQRQSTGSKDFKPNYFLHYTYQPEFGNPYGKSDLRAAHQAWKTKKFFLRFWAIYVERFAAPTIIGEYPDDFDSAKVTRLQAVLKTIQNSTVAVMPEGTKIDFKMPQRDSSDIYEKGITLLNTMMARALLMPDLLGISGDQTKGGSYALGQTQFKMFIGMIKKDQQALARKFTLSVIRPLVLANWGDYPCSFEFRDFSEGDLNEAARIWVDATKSNIWTPNDEEVNHLRELLKFPTGEVKIKTVEPVNPMDPTKQPGRIPANGGNPDMPAAGDARHQTSNLPAVYFRDKTAYEGKVDFAEISAVFQKIESSVTPKIRAAAKDVWLDYVDQIRDRNLLTRFKPELINELRPRFQRPMNVEFRTFMKDAYQRAFIMAKKEMFPNLDKKLAMSEDLLPEEFLSIVEAEAFKLVGDYSVNITNKMRNKLIQGIKNGLNERDLMKDLKEIGTEETERWLETVIRTKATEMFNRARKSYWDNDELAKQIVEAYQFSAVLDDRTSEVCRFLDGKVFDKGEFITRATPPLHFNCRSILVPVTKFEDYSIDKAPSLESLKNKGGNLVLSSNAPFLPFKTDPSDMKSDVIKGVGRILILSPRTGNVNLKIEHIELTNLSSTANMEIALCFEGSDELYYRTVIKPQERYEKEFDPWILPRGKGLMIYLGTGDGEISYTVEYF